MLTSTIMIRRSKRDTLRSLPTKTRERVHIDIEDQSVHELLQLLRRGRGNMGRIARQHDIGNLKDKRSNKTQEKEEFSLPHLYKLTGQSKVNHITEMLVSWLADETNGKLCIFAHHLDVLNEIGRGAGLSNELGSTTKFIRIDGSTSRSDRKMQIQQFETDASVKIALLGITAASVAISLTASSTVWFAELFWTPAIMVQAEDRW